MINKKLLIKSIIYRILAFIFMFILCMILTKEIYISIIAGIIEFTFKIILYYLYEIGWKKVTKIIGVGPKKTEE